MKKLITLALLTALVLPVIAVDTYTINGRDYIGCVNKEDFEELTSIAVQGDNAAFENFIAELVVAGTITLFKEGESVYLEDAPWGGLTGSVQLRRPGERLKYWTNSEAIYDSTNSKK